MPSVCGINCDFCEQFLSKECAVCTNEKSKADCEALNCAIEKMEVESCFDCQRVTYCEKRHRAMEMCLVFRPRKELAQCTTYALQGSHRDVLITFAKHVYGGKKGLVFTNKNPSELKRDFMLEEVEFYMFSSKEDGNGKIHFKDLDGVKKIFAEKIKEKDIVLLDSLDLLINENSFKKIVNLIGWMNTGISSHKAALILLTENLPQSQREELKDVITDSRVKQVLKSVSNPRRMEIIDFLTKRGKSFFTDIYDELRYSVPPKLSFHLRVLKRAGVIEQDDKGIYYISELGKGVAEIVSKIEDKIGGEKVSVQDRPETIYSKEWSEKYEWYVRRMRRIDFTLADILNDVENSLQLIFGKRKTQETFQIILTDYVETEKTMSYEDIKRMIREIAFVFLVESIPLVEAIDWADELLKKHDLKS